MRISDWSSDVCSSALNDEFLVIVDVEQGLRGVGHPPDHLRRHLDRVAAQVVDLDLYRNDVVRAYRDLPARQPGQHPAQPALAVGALVTAEKLNRDRKRTRLNYSH